MRIEHLYFHFPFCATICPYCGFYVTKGKRKDIALLTEALIREVEILKDHYSLDPKTVYIGGGTPSLAKSEEIKQLLSILPKENLLELTIEANPRTITEQKAAEWKETGINRVSIGAQSMNEQELLVLGRRHKPRDVIDSVHLLRKVGIENINLDFIFGIPGQDLQSLKQSLQMALDLAPRHISLYCLTYEENTPFFKAFQEGKFRCDEQKEIEMMYEASDLLTKHGFIHYEISNFALPGYKSLHNQAYWQGKDYLGVGPSACSTVGTKRWKNVADHSHYVKAVKEGRLAIAEMESLDGESKNKERIFLGLRTDQGVAISHFGQKEREVIQWLVYEGLGRTVGDRFVLTPRGLLVADSIALYFMN
ncbi:coproporphyrinogen III oxidase [Methylacidiphilum kamchatkense Kam1]|uniref:Heme chaperone HemW n=1 Tax=Methylacidiphilum kamchatkense Kam1 TaxID=1202785 RepID=A0A0C1RLV3_9BACT|nr:radical SAM family heme chaperone HemW [Methylacidiphilum kamchatkense]KIE59037.1 coproporphyrinogen III oxidase [Methylacidiphilum kamchatkense Kam1]QDQ43063.1 oxygen-independent coproporphyrinogen-3 oxidase [Methylacidiphilum kamchatkense Kam1]